MPTCQEHKSVNITTWNGYDSIQQVNTFHQISKQGHFQDRILPIHYRIVCISSILHLENIESLPID